MSDKKNIDRLFQEKFKDFEVEPNEQIWINIDAALREKKERRVLPLWFRLTGIAAGLILGFFAFNFFFNDTTSVQGNQVVIGNEKQENKNNPIEASKNESVVNTEKSTETNNLKNNTNTNATSINQKTNGLNSSPSKENNAIVKGIPIQKNQKTNAVGNTPKENNAVANTSRQVEKTAVKKDAFKTSIATQNKGNAIANSSLKSKKEKKATEKTNLKTTPSITDLEDENVVANHNTTTKQKNISGNNTPKGIIAASNPEENNAVAVEKQENLNHNDVVSKKDRVQQNSRNTTIAVNEGTAVEQKDIKSDSFQTVDTTTKDLNKKDSTALVVVEPNALEELLKKNEKEEEKKIAEAKINRWQITSSVAPIYFSSTSNGSPIDDQFAENSKSYENNLSFGVGVNYAVNKKISVRTGVNKFTLGYSTNDVIFFAALDQVSFASLSSSAAGSTIQVISENNSEALRPFSNGIQNTNEGIMTQRMGYFEVPVEMSYKLIDKQFGINIIGGLSTLFLNENEVSVSSSTMSASLGKAKNLNDIHFSTNVGLGFKYRFWKSFEANFEPMFKYQINTFNKDAGNFKPYFIGLYSGVSFNF